MLGSLIKAMETLHTAELEESVSLRNEEGEGEETHPVQHVRGARATGKKPAKKSWETRAARSMLVI